MASAVTWRRYLAGGLVAVAAIAPVALAARGLEPEDTLVVGLISGVLLALISARMWGLLARMGRSQRDLQTAEARYRTIVERVPAITYTRTPGLPQVWRFVSPQIEDILGFAPEAWTVDPGIWARQLHPLDRERVLAEVAQAGRTFGPVATEYRMLHRNGHVVWLRDEGVCIRSGEWVVQGILRDVSEQKAIELRLRDSEGRKAAMLRSALDSVVTIDHEGRILEFNPAAERTFGYAQDDVLGKLMAELIVPPALRDRHREAFERHMETGESAILGTRVELTAMRSDGSEFPVELTVVRVEGSRPPVFTGYLRDITERKEAEQALRDSEERHRLMFEGNPQPTWVMDKETLGFLEVNEAALLQYGYTAEEFLAMTVRDIRPSSEVPKLMASLADSLHEPEGQRQGHRHRRKDGTVFEVEVRWRDFVIGGKEVRLVVAEDLSGRRVAEEAKDRLASVLEATSDFVAFADPDGRVTYINDAGRAMIGITDEELGSLRVRDLYAPWARRLVANQAAPTAVREGTWNGETALQHRDGSEIPVSQVTVAHRTASGEVDFFSTSCRDITGQKAAARERELLLEMERAAGSELEAGRRRLELLDGASRVLGSSLDYEKTLSNVVHLVVPEFADLCAIHLVSADGATLEHVEVAHSDPSKQKILEEWQGVYGYDQDRAHGAAKVVRTKKAELWPQVSDALLEATARDARQLGFLRALEIRSAMTVPLLASGGRCLGAITMLSSNADRAYSEADLVMATDLAIRCALAVDNARLFDEARQAVKENQETLALLNALFATAPIGVVLVDRELRIVRANEEAAALQGKRSEEMIGAGVQSLLPSGSDIAARAIRRVLRTRKAVLGIEVAAGTPSQPGRLRHWLTSYYPVRAEGKVAGIGVVLVEITDRKEAEDALRLSEERWKSIFATTGVGITIATSQGRFIAVNPAYCRLLGYTEDELLAMGWPELTHPDDVSDNWKHLERLRRDRPRSGSFEKRVRRKDGTYLHVLMDVARVLGPSGELISQVAITQDVTEQRQAEERLRRSEERLRLALEAGAMGTWTYDPATKRETWDETMEKIYGVAPGVFPGTFEAFLELVHPEDRDRVASSATAPAGAREIEFRVVRPDGVVRTVLTRGDVVTDEEGSVVGDVGIAVDITERKEAEAELEARVRQQAALAELFQSALTGAEVRSLMDETCVVLSRTLDVDFAEVLELLPDRNVLKMVSGVGWREGTVGTVEVPVDPGTQAGQALLAKEPVVVRDVDTDTRFVRSVPVTEHAIESGASVPIIGQDGPLGVLGVFSSSSREFDPDDLNFLRSVAGLVADGMDRLRAEQALRRTLSVLRATDDERRKLLSRLVRVQEEERARIAADIHDDSIQVMTALSLRLQMLKEELTEPEQLDRLVELEKVLEKTIGRLRHLLFELRPPALDREGLTPALRDYLQRMAEEDGASFSLDNRLVEEPETEARVIVYRIAQEALVNVRKHARASNVEVSLDEREGGVFVTIQDDGQGFSPETDRIGVPGHLGLTAMRERAEMAGGWLKVITRPGAGTSIQFWVPAEKMRV